MIPDEYQDGYWTPDDALLHAKTGSNGTGKKEMFCSNVPFFFEHQSMFEWPASFLPISKCCRVRVFCFKLHSSFAPPESSPRAAERATPDMWRESDEERLD